MLGKGDFRQLIKWRLRLVKYRDELRSLESSAKDDESGDMDGEMETDDVPITEEEKEEEVQAEIRTLQ